MKQIIIPHSHKTNKWKTYTTWISSILHLKRQSKHPSFFKDVYGRLRKKTSDYSGLNAAIANELYVDSGVVRTRPTTKDIKE